MISSCFAALLVAAVFVAVASGSSGLPELHKIQRATLSPYSCHGSYATSALFLSDYSNEWNDPDLLYDGTCDENTNLTFHGGVAGNDLAALSAIGDYPLEDISASKALNYLETVHHFNTFTASVIVQVNKTYSAMLAKTGVRALFALTVVSIDANKSVTIDYAVLLYELKKPLDRSPNFNWSRNNSVANASTPRCQGTGSDCLPTLNAIYETNLIKPYSCITDYNGSALSLSTYSQKSLSPDLLWYGNCETDTSFWTSTAGNDLGLIAYLGPDVPLESVQAQCAINYVRTVGHDNVFQTVGSVKTGTYVVISNKSDLRALFAFTVVQYDKNGPMTLRYASLIYSVDATVAQSPGFDWKKKNHF